MAYFNEDNVTEQMCIAVAKINHITLAEAQIVIQKVKDVIFQGMTGLIILRIRNYCLLLQR